MSDQQERFGELRSLLMGKQSTHYWNKICRLLDQWDEDEHFLDVVLPYAVDYLRQWPHDVRMAPQRWVKLAIAGEPTYRMQIATQLSCSSKNYSDAKLATLFSQPAVASIVDVDLYSNYGSGQLVDALLNSAYTTQIKVLGLGHNRLCPEELVTLVQSDWFTQIESFSMADMCYKVTSELEQFRNYLDVFEHPSCTNLRALNLSWSFIEAEEFIKFARSEHLPNLVKLDMYHFYSLVGGWSEALRQLQDSPLLGRLTSWDFFSHSLSSSIYDMLLQNQFDDEIVEQLEIYRDDMRWEEENCQEYYDSNYE